METSDIKQQLLTLKIISTAIPMGAALFLIVVFAITRNAETPENEVVDTFYYIIPVIGVVGLMLSRVIFKISIKKISESLPLKDKLTRYQTACIIRIALVEAPALFTCVAFMLTADNTFGGIAVALILLMFINFPTKSRIINELRLDAEQRNELLVLS